MGLDALDAGEKIRVRDVDPRLDRDAGLGQHRLQELDRAGRIGSLAARYHGAPTEYSQRRTIERDAPEILRRCHEDGVEAGPSEAGQLEIRGDSTTPGYWNRPELNEQTIVDGWLRTGDQYVRDEDGYFQYQGRADDMIKVGGIWCSPFDIEARLIEHPAVLEAAVVGRDDEHGLVKPEAFVVLAEPLEETVGAPPAAALTAPARSAAGALLVFAPPMLALAAAAGPDLWQDLVVFPLGDFPASRPESLPLWPAAGHYGESQGFAGHWYRHEWYSSDHA